MKPNSLFNLAGPGLFFILVIVLLLFGLKKLPELGRHISNAIEEFMKARDKFEQDLTGLGQPPPRDRRSELVSQVLLYIAVLAGLLSIAVAMES